MEGATSWKASGLQAPKDSPSASSPSASCLPSCTHLPHQFFFLDEVVLPPRQRDAQRLGAAEPSCCGPSSRQVSWEVLPPQHGGCPAGLCANPAGSSSGRGAGSEGQAMLWPRSSRGRRGAEGREPRTGAERSLTQEPCSGVAPGNLPPAPTTFQVSKTSVKTRSGHLTSSGLLTPPPALQRRSAPASAAGDPLLHECRTGRRSSAPTAPVRGGWRAGRVPRPPYG